MSDHHDSHGHDDWFRHSSDEALPQQEHAAHVNTTAIGLTLLAIVFGVLLTVVLLSMYFVQYANSRKAEMNEGTGSAEAYLAYRDQADATLASGGWADRAAGTVNLAIDDAIEGVLSDYASSNERAQAEWVGPSKPQRSLVTESHADPHEGDAHDDHADDGHGHDHDDH